MSNPIWLVVVDPTCTILSVGGGAPERWIGRPAGEIASEAAAIAEAAVEIARAVGRGAGSCCRSVSLRTASGVVDVGVLGAAAIAIQRASGDLAAIVDRALGPFRRQAEDRDIELRLVVERPIGAALVDDAKIGWVVATLVANALRFTRSGTRHLPGGTVTTRIEQNDATRTAVISVEDEGPGIERDRLARLFERADATTPPTAVALMMAREVVAAHGGTLTIESSTDVEPHGTTVRVELPLA